MALGLFGSKKKDDEAKTKKTSKAASTEKTKDVKKAAKSKVKPEKASRSKPVKEKPERGKKKGERASSPKPSESIGTVLDESVPAAALEVIKHNSAFALPYDEENGFEMYLVATVYAEDIGGLNKHMKSDPSKGQFIEQVSNREIETYVSAEGIKEGKFVIIPSEKSMRNVNEYSFLADPGKYSSFIPTIVKVDKSGDMIFEEIGNARTDFRFYADILKGMVPVTEAVDSARAMSFEKRNENEDEAEVAKASYVPEKKDAKKKKKGQPVAVEDNGDSDSITGGMEFSAPEDTIGNQSLDVPPDVGEPGEPDAGIPENIPDGETEPDGYEEYPGYNEEPMPEYEEPPIPEYNPGVPDFDMDFPDQDAVPDYDGGSDVEEVPVSQEIVLAALEEVPSGNAGYIGDDEKFQIMCPQCHQKMDSRMPCPHCGYVLGTDGNRDNEDSSYTVTKDGNVEISDKAVNEVFEMIFHAGGISLQVTAEPFDLQFVHGNDFVPIPESRGDGWLNGYVTQMAKNANYELRQQHQRNLFLCRERYFTMMTNACESITQQVDIDNPANEYCIAKQKMHEHMQERRNNIDREVDERKNALKQRWDVELKEVQEAAKNAAKQDYIARNDKRHDAELRQVEIELQDAIEVEYQRALKELNDRRQIKAKELYDLMTTQTLVVMAEEYKQFMEEEDAARQHYIDEINRYIDEHRQDEVARNSVLREELQQKDIATRVTEEFARKIQALSFEHESNCDRLRQEVKTAKIHEESLIKDYTMQMNQLRKEADERKQSYDLLMEKYVNLDNLKSREYETRMQTLENDKKAAEEHLAHVDFVHNKYNKVSIIVWVAVAVAMFAIGTLLGTKFAGGSSGGGGGHYSISFSTPEGEYVEDAPAAEGEDVSLPDEQGNE